jgi:hypothetical protein
VGLGSEGLRTVAKQCGRTLVYVEGDASMSTYQDAEGKSRSALNLIQRKPFSPSPLIPHLHTVSQKSSRSFLQRSLSSNATSECTTIENLPFICQWRMNTWRRLITVWKCTIPVRMEEALSTYQIHLFSLRLSSHFTSEVTSHFQDKQGIAD